MLAQGIFDHVEYDIVIHLSIAIRYKSAGLKLAYVGHGSAQLVALPFRSFIL
jgi:hypothetical protein